VTFTKPFTQVSIAKLGWVADFSGTGFADFQTVITAGGVRATLPPCGNWTFFGQFQFGALMEHDSFSGWSTEWGYAPGIGLVLARPNWKWDVLFQADLGWVEKFVGRSAVSRRHRETIREVTRGSSLESGRESRPRARDNHAVLRLGQRPFRLHE
jgi:hypothetical protein